MRPTAEKDSVGVVAFENSPFIRRILKSVFECDKSVRLLNINPSFSSIFENVIKNNADVVVIDSDKLEVNIVDAIKTIRILHVSIPIIVLFKATSNISLCLASLKEFDAIDYIVKPSANLGGNGLYKKYCEQLLPKVITYGLIKKNGITINSRVSNQGFNSNNELVGKFDLRSKADGSISDGDALSLRSNCSLVRAVCIGVSTGGPSVLMGIFSQFTASIPVPIFIVQHMPANFTKKFAERLSNAGVVNVVEAVDGQMVVPGVAYIAPGGFHMELELHGAQIKIVLNENPPENSCRPSVDVLFRSAAKAYGKDLLAVVLTGMGSDGLKGCQSISEVQGQVIAQDKESSVVWGMPGAVVQNNLADAVLPACKIASEIVYRTRVIPA